MEIEDKYIPLIIKAVKDKQYLCISNRQFTLANEYKKLSKILEDEWDKKLANNE